MKGRREENREEKRIGNREERKGEVHGLNDFVGGMINCRKQRGEEELR